MLVRPGLQVIMPSWVGIDGRGWPVVRKAVLEQDLAHTMKQTTALCRAAAAYILDGDRSAALLRTDDIRNIACYSRVAFLTDNTGKSRTP